MTEHNPDLKEFNNDETALREKLEDKEKENHSLKERLKLVEALLANFMNPQEVRLTQVFAEYIQSGDGLMDKLYRLKEYCNFGENASFKELYPSFSTLPEGEVLLSNEANGNNSIWSIEHAGNIYILPQPKDNKTLRSSLHEDYFDGEIHGDLPITTVLPAIIEKISGDKYKVTKKGKIVR